MTCQGHTLFGIDVMDLSLKDEMLIAINIHPYKVVVLEGGGITCTLDRTLPTLYTKHRYKKGNRKKALRNLCHRFAEAIYTHYSKD